MRILNCLLLLLLLTPTLVIAQDDWAIELHIKKGDLYHVVQGNQLIATTDIIGYIKKLDGDIQMIIQDKRLKNRNYYTPRELRDYLKKQKKDWNLSRQKEMYKIRPCVCILEYGRLLTWSKYDCGESCAHLWYIYD